LRDERERRRNHHGAPVTHPARERRRRYVAQDLADAEQGERVKPAVFGDAPRCRAVRARIGAIAPLPISKIIAGRNADGISDFTVTGLAGDVSSSGADGSGPITSGSRLRYASWCGYASRLRYASAVTSASRLRYASACTAQSFVDYSNVAVRDGNHRELGGAPAEGSRR
jgi:hypothetical protein